MNDMKYLFGLLMLFWSCTGFSQVFYASTEEGANSIAGRANVEAQRTAWESGVSGLSFTTFSLVNPITTSKYLIGTTSSGISVYATFVSLGSSGIYTEASLPILSTAGVMQDSAPRPTNFPSGTNFWNEASGNNTDRNGVLFEFSSPVQAFGVWVADFETRPNGGTGALMRVNGSLDFTVPPDEPQSVCGGSAIGCGNKTTRWVGVSGVSVSSVLLVVGDNDAGGTGGQQHLSWIGPTVGEGGTPNVVLVKSVLTSGLVLPGSDVTYRIAYTNSGTAPALNLILSDQVPAGTDFKVGSLAGGQYFDGSTWSYVPVSGGGGAAFGYDRIVKAVRIVVPSLGVGVSGNMDFVVKVK